MHFTTVHYSARQYTKVNCSTQRSPVEIGLSELFQGNVPQERVGAKGHPAVQVQVQVQVHLHLHLQVHIQVQVQVPAGRAGADFGVLLALFTDKVAVVTLEDPAWGHHHLQGDSGAE